MTNPTNHELTAIQWNCRGLKPNIEEMKGLMKDHNPKIICLQETLMKQTDNLTFKNYEVYNKTNLSQGDHRPIGGTAILIKKTTPHEKLHLNTELQAIAVRATLHQTISICSIYIPPKYKLKKIEIEKIIEQLPTPFLILGDFNAHSNLWGNEKNNNNGKIIESILDTTDICILNNGKHTYLHPSTGTTSAIDLTLSSPTIYMDFQWDIHEDQCGSDHYPIFIKTNNHTTEDTIPKWQLKRADWPTFRKLCQTHIDNKILEEPDPITTLTQRLHKIAEETIPKTTKKHSNHKPWFTKDCKDSVKKRKKALKKFRLNPTTTNLQTYRQARAKARQTIKKAKRETLQDYVSKLKNETPSKKVWDMVRKIQGKQTQYPTIHLKKSDGGKCTEKKDITNTLAEEFNKNSSPEKHSLTFQNIKKETEKEKLDFSSNNTEKYNMPFTLSELKKALNKSRDTATGPDQIHYQFLKQLPETSLKTLLNIFNNIWHSGNFPSTWRESTIIPIPKPNKDLSNPTNYRPIALTSCICKTMERLVNNRLIWILEKNKILDKHQCGFRKNRSTIDQLVRMETYIRDGLIRDHHVVSVFFDLEKAYDTTWKYGIMKDLHEIGMRGNMPTFIENFLKNRTFRVHLGGEKSETYEQEMGVPQGSILSVTLFLLKINSITKAITPNIDKSLFVDDFAIIYSSPNMTTIEKKLQESLNRLERWADENGFTFSKTKTLCLHFCQKRSYHLDPQLKIKNSLIPMAQQTKYLGMILDNKLNYKPHIEALKKKCQKAINILKIISHTNWGADRKTMIKLYRALIRSKLDYGCILYSSARKTYLEKLKTVQNQALRLCLGAFQTSPIQSLHTEANELPLHLRWEKLLLQYMLKLKSNPENPAYKKIYETEYEHYYTSKPKAIKPLRYRLKNAITDGYEKPKNILTHTTNKVTPWTIAEPRIDLTLRKNKKNTNNHLYQSQFLELKEKYSTHIPIYTDGSKISERVGAAAQTNSTHKQMRLPDGASIYTAELQAIKMALELVQESNEDEFIIFSDSMSSLIALEGENADHPFIQEIMELHHHQINNNKTIIFAWIPSHVGIRGNTEADKLAKEATNLMQTNLKIPYTDKKNKINIYIKTKWQKLWNEQDNNKLKNIHPNVGHEEREILPERKLDTAFTRVRIGHTRLTHEHLLKGETAPQCRTCGLQLTIKHILIECKKYERTRKKYYNEQNIGKLFEEVSPYKILNFLKKIDLLALI